MVELSFWGVLAFMIRVSFPITVSNLAVRWRLVKLVVFRHFGPFYIAT